LGDFVAQSFRCILQYRTVPEETLNMRAMLPAFHNRQRLSRFAITASAALVCLSVVGRANAKRPIAFDDSHTAGDEKEQGSHGGLCAFGTI